MSIDINVAVVADPSLISDRYGRLSALTPEINVVTTVSSVRQLAPLVDGIKVAIVDLRLTDGSSPAENVSSLVASGVQVIATSSAEDRSLIQQAARAGALGLLRRSAEPEEIVTAIRRAAQGVEYVTADWAAAIDADPLLAEVPLTAEQESILLGFASGEPDESMAARLRVLPEHIHDLVGNVRQQLTLVANISAPALHHDPSHPGGGE